MSTTENQPSPVVCTLVDEDLSTMVHREIATLVDTNLAGRTLEWTDLASLQLSSEHIKDGVASTYPLALADRIEDLAKREAQCCGSWLSSSLTLLDNTVRLELTTPNPDGIELIVAMFGLASDS